jgi:hypothetical protein
VIWYVAAIASDLAIELRSAAATAEAMSSEFTGDIYDTLLMMQKHAGKLAENAAAIRVDGCSMGRRERVELLLAFTLQGVARLCVILGTDLGEVCKANIKKLFQRKETGTLKGDGDNREQTAGSADPPATCGTAAGALPQTMYRLQSQNGAGEWYDTGDFFPNSLDAAKRCMETTGVNNVGRAFRILDNLGAVHASGIAKGEPDYRIQIRVHTNGAYAWMDWSPHVELTDRSSFMAHARELSEINQDDTFQVVDLFDEVIGTFKHVRPDANDNGNSKAAEDLFPRKAA